MNTHTRTSTRLFLLSLLAVGPASLAAPAPVGAQQIPWIGLTANGAQLLGEVGPGFHGPGPEDHFGFAVAAGDFAADGFDDLATGIPGNDCDSLFPDCGTVQVRFGRAVGPLLPWGVLDPADNPNEPAEAFDEYGYALATGDFNNDGHDDLAVGIPGKDAPSIDFRIRGAVEIHYGVPDGIQLVAAEFLQQHVDGVPFEPWSGIAAVVEHRFGHALAVGDFNGDGHDDLAMGAPYALNPTRDPSGNVIVAHGHADGLMPFAGFLMRLGREGLPDVPEEDEQFGYALAAGDFNNDGWDDLAIGVPSEDGVGAVLVVYGSPFSLIFPNHFYFGSFDLGGPVQDGMRFGEALAAGDFDGDGYDDLAVGSPRHAGGGIPPTLTDSGLVTVVYGSGSGLTPNRLGWFWEEMLYGANTSESFDVFGAALAAGDFDGDGVDDLAIGTHGEGSNLPNSGAVTVLRGRPLQDLGGTARQLRPGPAPNPVGLIPDVEDGEPFYGSALAAGDFDGNGFDDLAIGGTGRDNGPTLVNAGAVAVVYGQLFADGFEAGLLDAWSVEAEP